MKAKSRGYKADLAFSGVFVFCCLFFIAGFFTSNLFSQEAYGSRQRRRVVETVDSEFTISHGETGDGSISMIPFQVISWKPRAFYFPNFATAEQCQGIINMAKAKLQPSHVLLPKGGTGQANEIRTRYIAFNVLRYEVGQKYLSHYDAIDPERYGPQKSQRVATFLLYLSDVQQGGETVFPYENGLNMDENYDYTKCTGLKVKPHLGDGILFYSLFPNNSIDPTSAHGSCPVIKGEKWVATKWIRDQPDS
ncbi:Oxoglutarate/iron-dependent dioxygenase [Corchorus capsularis]|uniref:Oxoglutarate/iron-dependent dioxygenase n=1 Tax=Corchorus capsularis TaxID=210143 RepID=A0A1R3GEL3_COCAP|nr:Oxoglutarate/iron-dependent dioxygenase [Corchorus capsularis]